MDLYPLDLILAVALAWATIFFAALPTRFLRVAPFVGVPGLFGVAWIAVALLAPLGIVHYYIFLGLLCFYAWWKLLHGQALSGKGWLIIAGGLGISLGVVLILAVTPRAFLLRALLPQQLLFLAAIYLDGAMVGLALTLYLLTRVKASRAGVSARLVIGYARLLLFLTLANVLVGLNPTPEIEPPLAALLGLSASLLMILVLPPLAWLSWRRVRSPAPSTGAVPLLAFCALGLLAAILERLS